MAGVLLVVEYDIKEPVIWRARNGGPHHKVVGVQVLEELDSAGIEVVVAPHLDELGTWVDAYLLVPVALHNNFLWLVAQLVQGHGLDDTVVHSYCRVVSTLLVLLGHTRIVRSELGLRGLRAK